MRTMRGRLPGMRRTLGVMAVAVTIALSGCTVASEGDSATPRSTPEVAIPDGSAALAGERGSIPRVVDRVLPSVVNVVVNSGQGQGEGTGFVIRSDGIVVTNWHVVENAQSLDVLTSDPENPDRFSARVIGGDPSADLAVLDIDANDLDPVPMGDSADLRLGQQVVALGYALGLEGGPSVTTGIVSSLNRVVTAQDQGCPDCPNGQRTYNDVIQTDAAINPGNSGGPLVNLNGEVVGINTAGAGSAENIGFAIQIDAAKPTILQAVENPEGPVAYLGVGSIDASDPQAALQFGFTPPVDQGALLGTIAPGGPAERAGLEVGDTVVGFDGEPVEDSNSLGELIRQRNPGDEVIIDFVAPDGQENAVTITLGTNPLPAIEP